MVLTSICNLIIYLLFGKITSSEFNKIKVLFNLSDRSNNNFPILIGRRTIAHKFVVDVSKNHTDIRPKNPKTKLVQKRLAEDPYKFHRKYVKKLSGNIDNIKLKKKGKA